MDREVKELVSLLEELKGVVLEIMVRDISTEQREIIISKVEEALKVGFL